MNLSIQKDAKMIYGYHARMKEELVRILKEALSTFKMKHHKQKNA